MNQGKELGVHMNKGRWRAKLLSLAGTLLFAGLLWLAYTQWKIASVPEAAPSVRTEIGIVLGASLWGDEPSPGLRERLNKALELYKEGRFDYIIVSGGLDRPDANFSEAEGMAKYLIDHGVSEDRVVLEGESTSTLENLRFSQRMMKERGWASATIVTHDFHGMRALEIAQALRYEQPQIVTVSSEVLSPLWHRGRESLAYTKWKWDELWIP